VKIENLLAELKRRNVYKVAAAYAVVGWLLVQVATQVFPFFEIPNWAVRLAVMATIIGFPIALVIAWAFEMTPEGLKRTEDVSPNETIPRWSRKKFAALIVIVAVLAAGLLMFQLVRSKARFPLEGGAPATPNPSGLAGPRPSIQDKSIAVLPFENLSDDKQNAYFADGIQDEILTKLASIADLKVISRTSTAKYKSKPENLKTVSEELGVATVLEGTVQKSGDKVRVNTETGEYQSRV